MATIAMEGAGAYNRHAKLQAASGSLALPLFEKAAEDIPLEERRSADHHRGLRFIAGKNSLAPICLAVKRLRRRLGPNRPILVFHVDVPSNDFTSLFEVANSDPYRQLSELRVMCRPTAVKWCAG